MPDAPFTEADVQLVANDLYNAARAYGDTPSTLDDYFTIASAALVVLAEAGRLLPPNPMNVIEVEQFGVLDRKSGGADFTTFLHHGDDEESWARRYAAKSGGEVQRRTVTTIFGQWAEVPQQDEETAK
jgi:hypothetical protein